MKQQEFLSKLFRVVFSQVSVLTSDFFRRKTAIPHAKKMRHTRFWAFSMFKCRPFMAKGEKTHLDGSGRRSTLLLRVSPIPRIDA